MILNPITRTNYQILNDICGGRSMQLTGRQAKKTQADKDEHYFSLFK